MRSPFFLLCAVGAAYLVASGLAQASTTTVQSAVPIELYKRREKLHELALRRDPASAGELMKALNDPDAFMRETSARALGDLKWSQARTQLELLLLKDNDAAVREAAAQALRSLRDPASTPVLIQALSDPASGVRTTVIDLLGYVGGTSAVPGLSGALKDVKPPVRRTAAAALKRIADPSSATALTAAVKDTDPYVRANAIQALGVIVKGPMPPVVREALEDPEPLVRLSAAHSLAVSGNQAGLAEAKSHAKSGDLMLQQMALETLGWSKADPDARRLLDEASKDPNPHIRQVAVTALQRMERKKP